MKLQVKKRKERAKERRSRGAEQVSALFFSITSEMNALRTSTLPLHCSAVNSCYGIVRTPAGSTNVT